MIRRKEVGRQGYLVNEYQEIYMEYKVTKYGNIYVKGGHKEEMQIHLYGTGDGRSTKMN